MEKTYMGPRKGLTSEMRALIEHHLPGRSGDTLSVYEGWCHEDYLEWESFGVLRSMTTYFHLDFPFDMMVVMERGNNFSKSQWKVIRETILNRQKPLMFPINSTSSAIRKWAESHGGEWVGDEVWFR